MCRFRRLCLAVFIVSAWVQVVRLSGLVRSFGRVFPPFVRSLALSLARCPCKYGSISRFKAFLARFGVVVWVCVACVLCVACVALYACGVRRIRGLRRVLPFVSSFVLSLCLLSCFACPLACLVCSCVLVALCCCFLFPCGIYAKRKGARVLPCVLACLVVGCFIWSLLCTPRTRQDSSR